MTKIIDISKKWKNIHVFQEKPGWCGPAIVQMVLKYAKIEKSQASIAKDIYKPWWGTTQQTLLAYLSRFFKVVNYKQNGKISDITYHLKKGNLVVVNWWDDLDDSNDADGHYSIIIDYDSKLKMFVMADPSNQRRGIWLMGYKDFNKRWYDTLDINNTVWIAGWLLWVDPKSKI